MVVSSYQPKWNEKQTQQHNSSLKTANLLAIKKKPTYLIKSKESIQNYKTSYEWHKLKQEIRAQSPFVKQLERTKQKHLAPNFVSDERKNNDIPRPKKEENQRTKLGIAQQ